MSTPGSNNQHQQQQAPGNLPAPISGHGHKLQVSENDVKKVEKFMKFIPDWMLDALYMILKKALKQQHANCIVMYLKPDDQIKGKKLEDKLDVVTLDYDPQTKVEDLKQKLANDYQELQDLRKRNKFLESKYELYLKSLQHGQ